MSSAKSLQAGARDSYICFLDPNDNIGLGNNTTSITAGQIRGSYPFVGIQQMPSGIPEGETVPVPGDDKVLGNFIFASDAPREFLMNFGQGDLELDALLQGTKVRQMGNLKIGLGDPGNPQYPTVSLFVNTRAIKRDSGKSGQAGWSTLIYPVVQIQPLSRETYEGRTAGVFRYKGVAQEAFNYTWGTTLTSAVDGNTSTYCAIINGDYPITADAFRGNGVVTNWVLQKTPVNDTNETFAFVERVETTITSIVEATKTATITPAVGDFRGLFVYGYKG